VPLADYRCATCGALKQDVYFTAARGAVASTPSCDACANQMAWIPQVGAIDAKEPFQRFSIYQDGQKVEIDSLHKMRQIEKESEQRYINGEGEPLRFRAYSQNTSNTDVSSFGEAGKVGAGSTARSYDSGQQPKKKANISVKRHGEKAPTVRRGHSALPLK
jgi:hypothetical protein